MTIQDLSTHGIRRAMAVAALGLAASLSFAQADDVRVTLNLKDADMMTATRLLFQRTGVQFVVRPSTKPFKKITLKLEDQTPESAVRYICEAAGAYFTKDDNGVFIISQEKFVEPTVETSTVKKAKTLARIKVLNQDCRDIYDLIMFDKPIDTSAGFDDLRRFISEHHQGNGEVKLPAGSALVRRQTNQLSYGPIVAQPSSTPIVPAERADDILLPGESANQFGRPGGGGGGLAGGGGQGGPGGGGGLAGGGGQGGPGGGGGQGGGATLQGGQGALSELTSLDFISYDPTDNSIIVRGSDEDIQQLRQLISIMDIAPDQIEIKVEFIAVGTGVERQLGYEFSYQRLNVSAGTRPGVFAPGSLPVFLNFATGNVVGRLRASLTETNSKIVTAPILRTLNNQPAVITSTATRYLFVPVVTPGGIGGAITVFNPVALTAGTTLAIKPRINYGDRTVTVYLSPTVGGFSGESVGPGGQRVPNSVGQQISVVARVKDGDTIVLGGLTDKNDQYSVNKVPILADIPIIGQFFRSTRRSKVQSDLLIFVTPRIIDKEEVGSAINPR